MQCLECLAALVTVNAAARDKLLAAPTAVRGQRASAAHALLLSALHRPAPQERHAAEAVLEALCAQHPVAQAQLAATLLPSGNSGPPKHPLCIGSAQQS